MRFMTVREVYALEIDGNLGIPAMVGDVQTFGDLIHWTPIPRNKYCAIMEMVIPATLGGFDDISQKQ